MGLTYSRVATIFDPGLNVGSFVSRTRDTGIVAGSVELAQEGQSKLSYLPRQSGAAIGDMVLTSGGNAFPKGLKIGTIKEISVEEHGVSLYAVIEPFADIYNCKDVFVITDFEGQGIAIGDDLSEQPTAQPQEEPSSSADETASQEGGQ